MLLSQPIRLFTTNTLVTCPVLVKVFIYDRMVVSSISQVLRRRHNFRKCS